MLFAALHLVFTQEHPAGLVERLDDLASSLAERFLKVAEPMQEPKENVQAFRDVPKPHWKKVWSTKLLERLNVEPIGALCSAV